MDVFQSVWFRLIYLLSLAVYITVLWFVLGPASRVAGAGTPWYGVSVAWVTCGLVVALPSPAVMRRVPCQWFRVPAREHLVHRMLGVGAFGWLLNISGWNRHVLGPLRGFCGKRAGFTLPGAVGTGRCCLTRNLLCYSRTLGGPRTFQQASVGRGTMDAVAGCGRSSLPGAATALYHASIAAAAT
jgi:hypothetical protein